MQSPTWLSEAWKELGVTERAGPEANARVIALFRDAHHPEIKSDETAWCAAFVGAALERAGIESTRSLMARSYLDWGEPADAPHLGSIAVFARGSDPSAGHVGFVLAAFADEIILLGGNQNNAVTVTRSKRANLLALRWPGEGRTQTASADFRASLVHVLEMEGGFDDDPHDPGGPTNQGITLGVFADWRGEVITPANREALKAALKTIDRETVEKIYFKRYWTVARCAELPPHLAFMHFDAAVNHGPGAAARMLQEAIGTEVDGDIGPATLAAARKIDPETALSRYAEARRARYRALPHFWRFGKGWLKRTDTTLARARARIPAHPPATGVNDMSDNTRASDAKWWGQSITIWGAITTALSAVLPPLASAAGFDISSKEISETGTDVMALAQAITAVLGSVTTIYGRFRATSSLERRAITFRI